jgi:hypothetical protein
MTKRCLCARAPSTTLRALRAARVVPLACWADRISAG